MTGQAERGAIWKMRRYPRRLCMEEERREIPGGAAWIYYDESTLILAGGGHADPGKTGGKNRWMIFAGHSMGEKETSRS